MARLTVFLTILIITSGAYLAEHWVLFGIGMFLAGVWAANSLCDLEHGGLRPPWDVYD